MALPCSEGGARSADAAWQGRTIGASPAASRRGLGGDSAGRAAEGHRAGDLGARTEPSLARSLALHGGQWISSGFKQSALSFPPSYSISLSLSLSLSLAHSPCRLTSGPSRSCSCSLSLNPSLSVRFLSVRVRPARRNPSRIVGAGKARARLRPLLETSNPSLRLFLLWVPTSRGVPRSAVCELRARGDPKGRGAGKEEPTGRLAP